jgi:Zn-dependent protease with chaperone function
MLRKFLEKLRNKVEECEIKFFFGVRNVNVKSVPEKEFAKIRRTMMKKVGKTFPVYIIESRVANSKATILNKIYISSRLYNQLSFKERLAVIFHEIAHIEMDRILPQSFKRVMKISFLLQLLITPIVLYVVYSFLLSLGLSLFLIYFLLLLICLRVILIPKSLGSMIEEIFADRFAKEKIGKKFIIGALKKLKKAYEELKESPFKIHFREKIILWLLQTRFYLLLWPFKTHPSIKERIRLLTSK